MKLEQCINCQSFYTTELSNSKYQETYCCKECEHEFEAYMKEQIRVFYDNYDS